MKIPHFTKCLGSLLTFALLTFSCSQDTETTFAELIVEETIATETITAEEEVTEEAAEPIIDYQKGTLVLSEDTKVALDITKGAEENSTSKKTYSLKSITQPKNGKTEMNNNNEIVYSPAADYNGDDSFSYTLNIQDSTETTVEQVNTFNITITPTKDVVDDLVTTTYETAKTIAPLANDTFAASSSVSITEISLANKGIAVLNSDNTITYTPNKATSGEDQIQYKTSITNSDASVSTENGTLKVTILNNVQPTGANIKYVTTTGKSTNTGATEASAWSISHAFNTAKAGDIVYIKAGNYGAVNLVVKNSGNASNPIQFIGYKTNPGDIESSGSPTISYDSYKANGNKLNSNAMPLLSGNNSGIAIYLDRDYVSVNNIQISTYSTGLYSKGKYIKLKNIIGNNFGNQSSYNAYDGWGIMVFGDYSRIESCQIINATAEAIKLSDSDYSLVDYCKVYADNPVNPTDYYILLTGGTNNSIVRNSYAERDINLNHGGHGIALKDIAENNTIDNCTVKRTSFEFNFSGVKYNTLQNSYVYGVSTSALEWHARIGIFNGANNNNIKNVTIQDTWTAINWSDYDDGYVGPDGDRDEISCGYDNTFESLKIKNTNRIINIGEGSIFSAKAKRNTIRNSYFENFNAVVISNLGSEDIIFESCSFKTGNYLVVETKGIYQSYSKADITFNNCDWIDVNFTIPN
jgi:hypothetical protein